MSVSGFTHSLAGNMDRLSQDQYQLNSTPRRFGGRSFATGVTQLVNGVFLGVTGVVTAPIRGAAQQGSWGFVKGCGIGMAGVVTKVHSSSFETQRIYLTQPADCDLAYVRCPAAGVSHK